MCSPDFRVLAAPCVREVVDHVVKDVKHVLSELQTMMSEIRSVVTQIDNVSNIIEKQYDTIDEQTFDVIHADVHRDVNELSAIIDDIYDQSVVQERYATCMSEECKQVLNSMQVMYLARSDKVVTRSHIDKIQMNTISKSLDEYYILRDSRLCMTAEAADSGCTHPCGTTFNECKIESDVNSSNDSSSVVDSLGSRLSNLELGSSSGSGTINCVVSPRYSIEYKDMPADIKRRCYAAGNRRALPLPYCVLITDFNITIDGEEVTETCTCKNICLSLNDSNFNYCGVYEKQFELEVEQE